MTNLKDTYKLFLDYYNKGFFSYKDGKIYKNYYYKGSKFIMSDTPLLASKDCTSGYRRVHFKNKYLKEHRLIFMIHNGFDKLFKYECIDHINGNKKDNRIENLRGLTIRENTLEAEKLGNYKRTYGTINGKCKLSEDDILEIKRLYSCKELSQYAIADKFNISQGHVSDIVNNKKRRFG